MNHQSADNNNTMFTRNISHQSMQNNSLNKNWPSPIKSYGTFNNNNIQQNSSSLPLMSKHNCEEHLCSVCPQAFCKKCFDWK